MRTLTESLLSKINESAIMNANKFKQEEIKKIVLSCKHSKNAVKRAIKSYIAEQDRHFGEFSVGNIKLSVVLDDQYDEETGKLINSDWQTTITISIVNNNVNVMFN